ncbi:hypothetical protein OROMI_031992 [Orobanche minor]
MAFRMPPKQVSSGDCFTWLHSGFPLQRCQKTFAFKALTEELTSEVYWKTQTSLKTSVICQHAARGTSRDVDYVDECFQVLNMANVYPDDVSSAPEHENPDDNLSI